MDQQQERPRPATRGMNAEETSQYLFEKFGLRYQSSTLMKLRHTGGGPVFYKAGRFPLYAETDVCAWAATKISPRLSSTSQQAA